MGQATACQQEQHLCGHKYQNSPASIAIGYVGLKFLEVTG